MKKTDVELLAIESDLLTEVDEHGRVSGFNGVGIAVAPEGWFYLVGARVAEQVARELGRILDDAPHPSFEPGTAPEVVARCLEVLEAGAGPVRVEGGPSYLIPPAITFEARADIDIVTSDDRRGRPRVERAPMSWSDDEWSELVSGAMGPWAIAVHGGEVVSVCHTSRPLAPGAAECGVWTHPAHRGRGLAPATTAAWAQVLAPSGRHLFYSTDSRNHASQRVAARLGLRLIGWGWTLDADGWKEGDAWGDALLDHLTGRYVPMPELEADDGMVGDAMHPEWFFRSHDEWDWWERELLAHVTRGAVLDLGAGAGRATLWCQERGLDVTAVDTSPGAIRVCRKRGVADARVGDLNDPPADKQWGAVLLLCGNLGLGGSQEGNRALLSRLAQVCAPGALLVGDTVEPGGSPDIGLRIRYKNLVTPWWRQRNIPVAEVAATVEGTGWTLERHVVAGDDHAVLLRRA